MVIAGHSIKPNPEIVCPPEILDALVALSVQFVNFEGRICTGIIEVHCDLVTDVETVFRMMFAEGFPLKSVRPMSEFGWNDELSMEANNTSGFNNRWIAGKKRWSWHAYGRGIDINPRQNPCVSHGVTKPAGAVYHVLQPGTCTRFWGVTQYLKERGWSWGGDWSDPYDPQHFHKAA